MSKKLSHDDYTVGWICPLEVEQIAALEMLDEEHDRLPQPPTDHNVYTLGSIAGHNVVIAGLHQPTNNAAAQVVTQMRTTFPQLKFGLLVGIGGGVPVMTDNGMIRLGDVVVSKPAGGHSGAVQYDQGRARAGHFERTGALAPPPDVLLNAAQDLAAKRARSRTDPVKENIKRIDITIRGLRGYKYPGPDQDHLYEADYIHLKPGVLCNDCGCDPLHRIKREADDEDNEPFVVVHRGNIACGELVVKNALLRDRLAREYGLICFETEAAGALGAFPCIVIRGISDYADTHKNDQWHGYVSEAAEHDIHVVKIRQDEHDRQKILDWLTTVDYGPQQSDFIRRRQAGTGQWFLITPEFQVWLHTDQQTLFCPGIPGAGKTILTSVVVEELSTRFGNNESVGVAYLYCNFWRQNEQKAQDLLANLLKQLTQTQPTLPSVAVTYLRVFIIIDALDECRVSDDDRRTFVAEVFSLQANCGANIFATSRFIPEVMDYFKGSTSLEIRASDEDVRGYLNGHMSQLPACVGRSLDLQEEIKAKIVKAVDGMFLLAQLHFDSLIGKRSRKAICVALKSLSIRSKAYEKAYDQAYESAMHRIEGQVADAKELAQEVLSWITCAKRPLTTTELLHALAVEVGEPELDEENLPDIDDIVSVCAGLVMVDKKSNITRLVHYTTQEYFERTRKDRFQSAQTDIARICATYLSFTTFESGFCQTDEEFEERLRLNRLYDYSSHNWGHHAREALPSCQEVVDFLKCEAKVEASSQALMAANHRSGLNYSQRFPRQITGLHLAAYFGVEDAARLLLESSSPNLKDSDNRTPLSYAAAKGCEAVVKLLLATDKVDVNSQDKDGRTPLSRAAANGHLNIIQALLAKDEDSSKIRDHYDGFPLERAAFNGREDAVLRLLGISQKWMTPADREEVLRHAALKGLYTLAHKLLVNRGLNVNASHEKAALHFATIASSSRPFVAPGNTNDGDNLVRLLLEEGKADMRLKTKRDGRTALHYAAEMGNTDLVQYFLKRDCGPDWVDVQDNREWTPLHHAAQNGHGDVLLILLRHGADVNKGTDWPEHALELAARKGHLDSVRKLLHHGANVNAKNRNLESALILAAWNGNSGVVLDLLQAGARWWETNAFQQTPMQLAEVNGHTEAAEILKSKTESLRHEEEVIEESTGDKSKADFLVACKHAKLDRMRELCAQFPRVLKARDKVGNTPLHYSAHLGEEAPVKFLCEQGKGEMDCINKFSMTALQVAAKRGHANMVRILADFGADVYKIRNDGFMTSLHWAVEGGNQEVVKILLQEQSDNLIHCVNQWRSTALHLAAESGNIGVVQLLLANGARKDAQNRWYDTSMDLARKNNHLDVFKELERWNISDREVPPEDGEGNSPLHVAACKGDTAAAKQALWGLQGNSRTKVVDRQNQRMETPLHLAARCGHKDMILWLIDKGADVQAMSKDFTTVLHIASVHCESSVIEYLISKGAKVNEGDHWQWTPLHHAARDGRTDNVQLLINEKADLHAVSDDGQTALHLAAENGILSVRDMLIENGARKDFRNDFGFTESDLLRKFEKWNWKVLSEAAATSSRHSSPSNSESESILIGRDHTKPGDKRKSTEKVGGMEENESMNSEAEELPVARTRAGRAVKRPRKY
ncbi:hypothetical protein ACKLNR_014177 [Fusarium oxysporum f. sp. zingiberi]